MNRIEAIIDQTLAKGVLTQAEHDELMRLINHDGVVDEFETQQLSRLSGAIEQGKLRVVDTDRQKAKHDEIAEKERKAEARRQADEAEAQHALSIAQAVSAAIERGTMTQREHDRVMTRVHADGKIDPTEKKLLSTLFEAIQSGRLTLISDERDDIDTRRNIEEAKRCAVAQDEAQAILRLQKQQQKAVQTSMQTDPAETDAGPPEPQNSPAQTSAVPPPPVIQSAPAPQAEQTPTAAPENGELTLFMSRSKGRRTEGRSFELESERLLDIKLNGRAWIKSGAMVAYYGLVKFTREGIAQFGITKMLKKAMTGEGAMLTQATGQGNVYLADQGKKISLIELAGHSLVVNGKNILAFEDSVTWDITYLRQFAAVWAGGFFNVRLGGRGYAAITTHFDPLILRVTPLDPVMTDVNATVAWSGSLSPQIQTDVSASTFIGRTSGETFQMRFEGDGFVIIQPYEEFYAERELNIKDGSKKD
jgi:uncharacterized protein (AIM24 family)